MTRDDQLLTDGERTALWWGLGGAVALVLGGLIVGSIEGDVLPGACQGLDCLFTTIVLVYAGMVAVVWLVVGVAVVLARKRWPRSTWRLWAMRLLAALSWAPLIGLFALYAT